MHCSTTSPKAPRRPTAAAASRTSSRRWTVSGGCRARFASAIDAEVLQPLQSAGEILGDTAVVSLEAVARSLRRLERAARRIGGAACYDGLLRHTVEEVGSGPAGRALEPVDRVRLVEILAGPEQALALLDGTSGC